MSVQKRFLGFSSLSMAVFFELAALYAIILLISHNVLRQPSLYIAGMMLIGGMCGIIIALLLGTTRRWRSWLCILIVGVLIFAITGQFNIGIRGWILWFVVMLVALRGSRLTDQGWKATLSRKYQLAGIGCTLVLSMFSFKISLTALDEGSLYAAGVISICSWLIRLNSEQVQKETLSDSPHQQGALKGFVRVNRRWSIIVTIVMLIFGAFTQLSQGFYWLWNQFTSWLNGLMNNMNQTSNPITTQPEVIPDLFPVDGEPTQEAGSPLWVNMLYWIVGIVVALVVIYLSYRLVRFIVLQIRKLVANLGSGEGPTRTQLKDKMSYMDKIEKIETQRRSRPFIRKRNIVPDDAHGKVRYYYKSMIQREIQHGLVYTTSQTPNEIVFQLEGKKESESIPSGSVVKDMTSLYNDVRYGDKAIKEDQLHGLIGRLKGSK